MRRQNRDTNEERKRGREGEIARRDRLAGQRGGGGQGGRGQGAGGAGGRAAGNLRPSSVMAARLGAIGTHVCPERESRIRVLASGGDVRP